MQKKKCIEKLFVAKLVITKLEENYKLKPEEKTTIKAKLTEKMKEEMQAKAWAIIQELY